MREKRVNLVVLISSVLVATCASVSCLVTFDSSFPILDKYVAVISSIPLFLSGQISSASAATVWIPSEPAIDTDGSVQDEFSEVAHVFARPGAKVVKSRDEDEITQQPVPWTSLKNEWKIYNQVHSSKRKTPAEKQLVKKAVQGNDEETAQQGDESSEEDEEGDEDEDEEEEDDEEGGGGEARASSSLPNVISKVVKGSKESIPLAFFGQQNHDDDERDYLKDEANVFKRKKSSLASKSKNKDEDNEEDDVSGSNEAASVEDYADYAADEDEGDENGVKRQQQKPLTFDDIPLAIREMILNDLANHNNGSGYSPNLTPKVTGGQQRPNGNNQRPQQLPSGGSGSSAENDESSEDNSSEEDEEEDDNPQQAPQQAPPQQFPFQSDDPDPTPPAIRPSTHSKKGDDEDEVYDDGGGKGKKGKGKKKKGKKGKGGWGWKPQGWGQVHLAPGWGHEHKDHGWGWDPEKHDGVLEQLVRGSTWERVLKYYHWKRDQAVHEEKGHHHHDDHYHGPTYGGPDFGHHDHGHDDHDHHGGGGKIKGLVKGAFKGSFWERAVHTYAQYKENQAKNPKKPALIDLDSGGHHH